MTNTIVKCLNCGKDKEVQTWRIKVKNQKNFYCDNKCYNKYRVANPSKYPHNGPKEHYPQLTKDFIVKKYLGEGKRIRDIAEEVGCGWTTVHVRMKKYKIDRKCMSDYTDPNKAGIAYWVRRMNIEIGKCEICSWDKGTCDVHHRIPKKDGGTNERSNLILICPNCHRLIHEKKLKIQSELYGDIQK